jgi:hypothetical protein
MQNEAEKAETTNEVSGRVDLLVIWLRSQWTDSLAKSIWDDMTPFGRLTIWLPLWLLCYVSLAISLPILFIIFLVYKIVDFLKLDRIPKIFFAR